MCHIIQTEDKKVFHSSKVNIQFFCYIDVLHTISSAPGMANTHLCELSLDIFVFVPTPRKSGAAKFTARKQLEWG